MEITNSMNQSFVNLVLQTEKYHRKKGVCPNCSRVFLTLTNWHDKNVEYPYYLDEYDD